MSAKCTWNARAVSRIFYPRPVSEALTRMQTSFPPCTMLDQEPRSLAIWKSITYPNYASHMPFKQHCFKGKGFCTSFIAQITGNVQRLLADIVALQIYEQILGVSALPSRLLPYLSKKAGNVVIVRKCMHADESSFFLKLEC